MNTSEDLLAQFAKKTNSQLAEVLSKPEDWTPEALDAAKAELQRRGVDPSTIPIGPPPLPAGQVLFFPVSPLKLVLMSTVTFGVYQVYWFYKNWQLIQQRTFRSIMPFWRAFFGIFFCHSLFQEVKEVATTHKIPFGAPPALLAVVWIILSLASRLPNDVWLITWAAPFVLLPVQHAINRVNGAVAPDHDPNSRFSGWNIAGLVVGGILFVLCMIGSFLPE